MANNNNQIFDAALTGFLAGSQLNRGIPTPLPAAEITAAVAFATEVDSLVPADGGIVTPTTSATLIKVQLMQSLCFAAAADRANLAATAVSYLAIATSIAAAYQQAVLSMALP